MSLTTCAIRNAWRIERIAYLFDRSIRSGYVQQDFQHPSLARANHRLHTCFEWESVGNQRQDFNRTVREGVNCALKWAAAGAHDRNLFYHQRRKVDCCRAGGCTF